MACQAVAPRYPDDMPRLTPFERITMAVEAQIPLVRAMEAALGKQEAHRLVRAALDKSNRAMVARRGTLLDIPTLAAEFAGFGEGVRYEFTTVEQTETVFGTIPSVNCGKIYASDVGHALLKAFPDAPFAMAWCEEAGVRYVSLRSEDSRRDVSEIARTYGGGGHRNAAGFRRSAKGAL